MAFIFRAFGAGSTTRRVTTRWAMAVQAGVLGLGLLASSGAQAAFVTSGCAAVNQFCTIQELLSPSAAINIDGVVFNNFREDLGFDTSKIKATPIDTPGSGWGSTVGLSFTPVDPNAPPWFGSAPNQFGGFFAFFDYDVNVLSGLQIDRAALAVTFIERVSGGFYNALQGGASIQTGTGQTDLWVTCEEAGLPFAECNGETVREAGVFYPTETLVVSDSLSGSVERVTGGGSAEVGVSRMDNTFTRVPEPASLPLLGIGLAALTLAGRGAKRKYGSTASPSPSVQARATPA